MTTTNTPPAHPGGQGPQQREQEQEQEGEVEGRAGGLNALRTNRRRRVRVARVGQDVLLTVYTVGIYMEIKVILTTEAAMELARIIAEIAEPQPPATSEQER